MPGQARDDGAVEAVQERWSPAERTIPAPLRDYRWLTRIAVTRANRSICSYWLVSKEQILPKPFATRRRRVARAPIAASRRGGRARSSHGLHLWRHVASATPGAGDMPMSPRPPTTPPWRSTGALRAPQSTVVVQPPRTAADPCRRSAAPTTVLVALQWDARLPELVTFSPCRSHALGVVSPAPEASTDRRLGAWPPAFRRSGGSR